MVEAVAEAVLAVLMRSEKGDLLSSLQLRSPLGWRQINQTPISPLELRQRAVQHSVALGRHYPPGCTCERGNTTTALQLRMRPVFSPGLAAARITHGGLVFRVLEARPYSRYSADYSAGSRQKKGRDSSRVGLSTGSTVHTWRVCLTHYCGV